MYYVNTSALENSAGNSTSRDTFDSSLLSIETSPSNSISESKLKGNVTISIKENALRRRVTGRKKKRSSIEDKVHREAFKTLSKRKIILAEISSNRGIKCNHDNRRRGIHSDSHLRSFIKNRKEKRKIQFRQKLSFQQQEKKINPNTTVPKKQYECVLVRRAIVKAVTENTALDNSTSGEINQIKRNINVSKDRLRTERQSLFRTIIQSKEITVYDKIERDICSIVMDEIKEEIEGEISLGMELTMFAGKVIVKNVTPLQDGRASPAQLSGLVKRGDVLLSVDGHSLIGLSNVDKMAEGLKLLSMPQAFDRLKYCINEESSLNGYNVGEDTKLSSFHAGIGTYKRHLTLKLLCGGGLQYLDSHKSSNHKLTSTIRKDDAVNDNNISNTASLSVKRQTEGKGGDFFNLARLGSLTEQLNTNVQKGSVAKSIPCSINTLTSNPPLSINDAIAANIFLERQIEQMNYASQYFSDNRFSILLRSVKDDQSIVASKNTKTVKAEENNVKYFIKTKLEKLKLGEKMCNELQYFCKEVELRLKTEEMTNPVEIAQKNVESTSNQVRLQNNNGQQTIIASNNEMNLDSVNVEIDSNIVFDGGKSLLQLAVYDYSWRKRMIQDLEKASIDKLVSKQYSAKLKKSQVIKNQNRSSNSEKNTLDDTGNQLQSLFFGDNISCIITNKKTCALPPDELTTILFDLMQSISKTVPRNVNTCEECDITGQWIKASLSKKMEQEVSIALKIMLDDILPLWLNTFHPLQLEQRYILWPLIKNNALSTSECHNSSSLSSVAKDEKCLEEHILNLELDSQSCHQTCELVTWYFTQKISRESNLTKIFKFVEDYGSYFNLHKSLLSVGCFHKEKLLRFLLETIGKLDLNHGQAMNIISHDLMVTDYDPVLLSALLMKLPLIAKDEHLQEKMLSLLVSALPDLKPCQVRKFVFQKLGCNDIPSYKKGNAIEKGYIQFYYKYLCILLDPETGNDNTRMNKGLVNDYCLLSTMSGSNFNQGSNTLQNFLNVASKRSNHYKVYNRDLIFLIDRSAAIDHTLLSIELLSEIVSSKSSHNKSKNDLAKVLIHIRNIAESAVRQNNPSNSSHSIDVICLREIMSILQNLCSLEPQSSWKPFVLSSELLYLIQLCDDVGESKGPLLVTRKEKDIIILIAEVAPPHDVLLTLSKWKKIDLALPDIIPILRTCLINGSKVNIRAEISGALLSLQNLSRRKMKAIDEDIHDECDTKSIWKNVLDGTAIIKK